jgi:hypothetical protein
VQDHAHLIGAGVVALIIFQVSITTADSEAIMCKMAADKCTVISPSEAYLIIMAPGAMLQFTTLLMGGGATYLFFWWRETSCYRFRQRNIDLT